MRLDKVEQSRIRHAEGGFCQVIGCPECEVLRQQRFGGKSLGKLNVTVVEPDARDIVLEQANRTTTDLERRLTDALAQLEFSHEAEAKYAKLAVEANARAQALGTEICGFVGAYVDLADADTGSPEFQEFASILVTAALVKLHDASHRLAPVQPN